MGIERAREGRRVGERERKRKRFHEQIQKERAKYNTYLAFFHGGSL